MKLNKNELDLQQKTQLIRLRYHIIAYNCKVVCK
jgi:hypothetical protein